MWICYKFFLAIDDDCLACGVESFTSSVSENVSDLTEYKENGYKAFNEASVISVYSLNRISKVKFKKFF